MPWTAPEVFTSSKHGYTEKADIYSFGVVLWELCARGRMEPYAGMQQPNGTRMFDVFFLNLLANTNAPFFKNNNNNTDQTQLVVLGVTRGELRPSPIADSPKILAQLSTRCWAQEASSRPAIGQVINFFFKKNSFNLKCLFLLYFFSFVLFLFFKNLNHFFFKKKKQTKPFFKTIIIGFG